MKTAGFTAAVVLLSVVGFAELPSTPILDQVQFGNKSSEKQHSVKADAAPQIPGGLGQSARAVQVEGGLSFTLKCDPDKPNLVTLQLWGGDVKQQVETLSGEKIQLGAEEVRITIDGIELKSDADEKLSDIPLYPGRFVYRSVALPLKAPQGRSEVSLLIKPAGASGGGYASVGGPAPKQAEAGVYSRGIYAAYLHTENVFVPSEVFGEVPLSGNQSLALPAPPTKPLDLDSMRKIWCAQLMRR